jgi:hypothetical protein
MRRIDSTAPWRAGKPPSTRLGRFSPAVRLIGGAPPKHANGDQVSFHPRQECSIRPLSPAYAALPRTLGSVVIGFVLAGGKVRGLRDGGKVRGQGGWSGLGVKEVWSTPALYQTPLPIRSAISARRGLACPSRTVRDSRPGTSRSPMRAAPWRTTSADATQTQ